MSFSICKQTRSGHRGAASPIAVAYNNVRAAGRSVLLVAIGLAGMVLASCGSEKSHLHFKNAQQGFDYYRAFVKDLKVTHSQDMPSIVTDIVEWQELEDSVQAVVMRDTAYTKSPHAFPHETMSMLHDAARDEFLNRAIGKPRTLQDVVTLKLGANRMARDPKMVEAVKTASPFFQSLDSVNIYNDDCAYLLRRYQTYLHGVEKQHIRSKQQLLMFMREEDRLFRSFAIHLWEMDGRSATDITRTTERIYAQMSRDCDSTVISRDDLFILFTMRTNRRLLVNAQACVADIKAGRVKTDDQRRAYLLMTLQPFTAINDFGLAMLTDGQKVTFSQVAKEASPLLVRLAGHDKSEREQVTRIADLMIKIYLSSL